VTDIDEIKPTVTITSTSSTLTSGVFDVTITFSEYVTGFVSSDVVLTNGILSNFAGSGTSYTAIVTPSADGSVTVDVPSDVAQDAATNNNTVAT
ncbi:Ig-like domain-containing protein, partial [Roseivirga seohaensis]|uniref:Ig-like domain-containing protein n=1 Tax=Roseivirga seohaensis TaxID=1914963 RepID=UPI001C879AEE